MADVIRMFNQTPGDSFPRPVLLIVDDDSEWRKLARDLCCQTFAAEQIIVLECDSVVGAIDILSKQPVHTVLLDKNLGTDTDNSFHSGIKSIPRLLAVQDHLQIIMATSSEDIDDVVEAMTNGACGYAVKHKNIGLFTASIKQALRVGMRLLQAKSSAEQIDDDTKGIDLPGSAPATLQLHLRVHEAAKTEAPIVLGGETGTGKSTVAKLLHVLRSQYLNKRASDRPFVRINMGAIPDNLAESELFGHEAGAFTDAKKRKFGALEQARGGTLFLDEIGEASPALQAKLLTALDEKKFFRLGGEQEVKSDFRLICATNRNLEQLVKEGKFREDLYRRIAILEIKVPSVRERQEDMPAIVRAVLPKCCKNARVKVDFEDIPKDFIARLAENPPSGNIGGIEQQVIRLLAHAPRDRKDRPILKQWRSIRELKINAAEVVELPSRIITAEELLSKPLDVVGRNGFSQLFAFLDAIEKKIYEDARRKHGSDYGSTQKIAKALGISNAVVSRRFEAHGLMRSARKARLNGEEGVSHERPNELQR